MHLPPFARALGVLALGASLGLQPATASPEGDVQTGPPCLHGPTFGAFNLPAGPYAGGLGGALLGLDGSPVLLMQAVVLPVPDGNPPLPHGVIKGHLVTPPTPFAPPMLVAEIHGEWVFGPDGVGHFNAQFIQPPMAPGLPPTILGGAQASFEDSPNPEVAGKFQGAWVVCP